jgi:hypothetical protein
MTYTQYPICLAELMRGLRIDTPTHGYKPEQAFEDGRKIAAKIEALEKAYQWQPIETAPKDMAPRLYRVNGRCVQGFVDATDMLCTQTDYQPWRKMHGTPTHWMPLPKPPIAGEAT